VAIRRFLVGAAAVAILIFAAAFAPAVFGFHQGAGSLTDQLQSQQCVNWFGTRWCKAADAQAQTTTQDSVTPSQIQSTTQTSTTSSEAPPSNVDQSNPRPPCPSGDVASGATGDMYCVPASTIPPCPLVTAQTYTPPGQMGKCEGIAIGQPCC